MGLTEDQKADLEYEAGRRNALAELETIEGIIINRIAEKDIGYKKFEQKYIDYVLEDSGNFIGSLSTDLLGKVGIYDILFEQVHSGKIQSQTANFQFIKLQNEYTECKKTLKKLTEWKQMFADASEGLIALSREFDEGRGSGELQKNLEKMELREKFIKGKIKERYQNVFKLFENKRISYL